MTRETHDLREISALLRSMGSQWQSLIGNALTGALLMGGFAEAVIERTPQSLYTRYKGRRDGMRYGQQRLLKSILPSGTSAGPGDFTRLYGKGSVTVAVGSNLEYAVYVHEAVKPAEGEMYAIGTRGPGWSKPGSGNKYLDRPWDETEEATFRELERNLDAALKALGVV